MTINSCNGRVWNPCESGESNNVRLSISSSGAGWFFRSPRNQARCTVFYKSIQLFELSDNTDTIGRSNEIQTNLLENLKLQIMKWN